MAIPDEPTPITIADLDPADPVPDGYVLLDVREDDEWEAGHAPGAVHIPLSELEERLDEVPEADVLVVCRTGGRSGRASDMLAAQGINAWNVVGGMKEWSAVGLPMASEDGSIPEVN